MKKLGYGAVEGWGVDMFGGTRHVESVVMMRNCSSLEKYRDMNNSILV